MRTRRAARPLALIAVAMAVLLVVAACLDIVAGDSLVVNAAASDGATVSSWGTADSTVDGVTLQGFAGGAPCDYERFSQSAYDEYHPTKISFAWSGNNLTACMVVGGQRLRGPALLLKYHDDLVYLTKWWTAKGVKVIYSAPLCKPPGITAYPNGDPSFRSMESGLAYRFHLQGYHVAYSAYAAQQICPGWTYVGTYRAADGYHLNPTGAARYASALRYESKHVNP